MKTWASLLCDIPVHASFSTFNINMDIFHLMYHLPGKNPQALHIHQKTFVLILSAMYSQGVKISSLSKTKRKDIGFLQHSNFLNGCEQSLYICHAAMTVYVNAFSLM